jgi:hypothetical protein
MPEQEPIPGSTTAKPPPLFEVDPTQHGLWSRVVEAGRISHPVWLRAVAEGGFVGTCRRCGSYLRPLPADDRGNGLFDYEAQCENRHSSTVADGVRTVAGCGAVMVAPGGRLPGTADRERKAAAAAKRSTGKGKGSPGVPA